MLTGNFYYKESIYKHKYNNKSVIKVTQANSVYNRGRKRAGLVKTFWTRSFREGQVTPPGFFTKGIKLIYKGEDYAGVCHALGIQE